MPIGDNLIRDDFAVSCSVDNHYAIYTDKNGINLEVRRKLGQDNIEAKLSFKIMFANIDIGWFDLPSDNFDMFHSQLMFIKETLSSPDKG